MSLKPDNKLSPYIIGDSMIYDLDGQALQIGPISVKDLSIHDLVIPEVIIFRPEDYLTIEFNFFHLFFVHKRKLAVYAPSKQINSLKNMMQIALFGGEYDWAKARFIQKLETLTKSDKDSIDTFLIPYLSQEIGIRQFIQAVSAIVYKNQDLLLSDFKAFINQELALKVFPVYSKDKLVKCMDDFDTEILTFIEYHEGEDIPINGYIVSVFSSYITISKNNVLLSKIDRSVRKATDLILSKFPPHLIVDLTIKHRHKLVTDGIAQIGSGDGMAYTPNQDTSCTLIRQSGVNYLLDASIQSIIKSAYLGINVYEDDIVAILTHGCHGDHGAGLYYIAKIRKMLGRSLKILAHPLSLAHYVEKCAYTYQNEYQTDDIQEIMTQVYDLFVPVYPDDVMLSPLNTHTVPTTGFYFKDINFYVTGDMSGAELCDNKVIAEKAIDVTDYYLEEDLQLFESIKNKVVASGFIAMECGNPPVHISRDLIYKIVGGESVYRDKIRDKRLFLYHTSGQEDASDWVSVNK